MGGSRKPVELDGAHLESLARALGDTERGLTGSEIGQLLHRAKLADPAGPEMTKWRRLLMAFEKRTALDGSSNAVLAFVRVALQPARFVDKPDRFEQLRGSVNEVLCFAGLEVSSAGELVPVASVRTLGEAQDRRRRLVDELQRRGAHGEVLRYCTVELLKEDCFHAVAEAIKGLMERLREMTGSDLDGSNLVEAALSPGSSGHPRVAINSLRTKNEKSEQAGMCNLIKGCLSAFRNPTAHAPRVRWHVPEADALDLFGLLSLIHRRLDTAVVLPI